MGIAALPSSASFFSSDQSGRVTPAELSMTIFGNATPSFDPLSFARMANPSPRAGNPTASMLALEFVASPKMAASFVSQSCSGESLKPVAHHIAASHPPPPAPSSDSADTTSFLFPKSVLRMVSSPFVGSRMLLALSTSRTNARTFTFRDRSSSTTYRPVRPVAPATATRFTRIDRGGGGGPDAAERSGTEEKRGGIFRGRATDDDDDDDDNDDDDDDDDDDNDDDDNDDDDDDDDDEDDEVWKAQTTAAGEAAATAAVTATATAAATTARRWATLLFATMAARKYVYIHSQSQVG